jgi:CRP-like cAMP-binding protein
LAEIAKILMNKYKEEKHFSAKESLFKEGEKIEGIYYIKNGNVKITRNAKNNIALWFANPYEFVGLSSYFNESKNYSFSTYAFGGDVDAVFIPSKDFAKLLDEYPTFKTKIIQILCDRITYTRNRVNNIKSQNIKERFLSAILLLVDKDQLNKSKATIHFSIDELSELTGTSKQYVKKLIIEFQNKNILEAKGDSLIVNMTEFKQTVN